MLRESFLNQCSRNVFMILFLLEHYHNVEKTFCEQQYCEQVFVLDEC